jgi:UPF0755 protein
MTGIRILAVVLVLLAAAVLGAGGLFLWGKQQFEAAGPLSEGGIAIIEQGSGLKAIAGQLESAGIITDARVFEVAARLTDKHGPLKAGEFEFQAHSSARDVLAIIRSGKTRLRRFTIAEGLTSRQIVDQIAATDGLVGSIYFSTPPEGSLLPETYYFSYGEDRQDVIRRMEKGMSTLIEELWVERSADLPLNSPEQAIILASIVEKETGVAGERARVASVFVNRLRKGMRLQSDPTVAYGITIGEIVLGRALTRADLNSETPYNTYIIAGLPPGPIASPGRAALEAVLHPAQADDLYFVADGSGGHAFAKTLEEHNRNVRKWRKIRDAAAE